MEIHFNAKNIYYKWCWHKWLFEEYKFNNIHIFLPYTEMSSSFVT